MLEKRASLERHADDVRCALMLEPRGHADMTGAVLTEPVMPGSHAGMLFLDNHGYPSMSGIGVIAATAIALARSLIVPGGNGATIVYDTPAGTVTAVTAPAAITLTNVPAFVLHAGLPVKFGVREIRADVAFGGAFYAIVDCEAVGIPLDVAHLPELRRAGVAIAAAVERVQNIMHPLEPALSGIRGTIFTGPPEASDGPQAAALRNVTVSAEGAVNRSPGGTATSAVLAVLDAMGLLGDDAPFVHESLLGTRLTGRVTRRARVGEHDAIVTAIAGSAWITGEHAFVIDEDDPLRDGFRMAEG